ncbi:MAG: flagellar filament capping protein FliD [Dorea sp.]|nr:flagellar filament capping protein FliD [Dorea sp.]
MATVGGLTNSTANSIRGYGGLASGMDRDTLIEGMTYGTTSKITQQQQKKQQLEWKQNAVRAISDMMIAFANKYTASLTSSNNLFSSMFWGRNNITTTGANSKFVSVTGTASAANAITIMGVKQMAQDAKWSSSESVSDMKLQTGKIGTTIDKNGMDGDEYVVQDLVGKRLDFEYGGSSYSVTLGLTDSEGKLYDYKTAEGIKKAINEQLSKVEVNDNTKLSDLVEIKVGSNDNIEIAKKAGAGGNALKVVGGNNTALDLLGFPSKEADGEKDKEWDLATATAVGNKLDTSKLSHNISFAEKVAGKELTFSYNGTSKTIYMPSKDKLDGTNDNEVIRKSLQEQLDAAYGRGRIRVELGSGADDAGKLSFTAYDPSTVKRDANGNADWTDAKKDTTSTLTIVSGSSDLVGANGVLGIKSGVTNRVNMNESLENAGLGVVAGDFDGTKNKITINGVDFTLSKDESVNNLIKRINESGAGVTLSYQAVGDKFTFTSNEKGASGAINISGDSDFLNKVFGVKTTDGKVEVQGQDAVVAVKYKGSDDVVELIRDSNSFTVDGLSIGVKGTFGYKVNKDDAGHLLDADGNPLAPGKDPVMVLDKDADAVEIDARVNTDNIVDGIKAMVEEYNKIIELVNKELTTKPDRDYSPLTSEQKKELSESEIETWEEKAKSGMLYGDSDLRMLSSDLRFIIGGGNAEALKAVGITTSTLYSDNGKLTLDESKLRAALETDPESVEKLFTAPQGTKNEKGNDITGIATNLKNVMDKYVKTLGSMDSKGILIKKAGSTSSPMSLTENGFYKQIAEINKQISKLQTRLESERDRYIKQFTSLETLISQMNSQSSWLSQLGGY